MSTKTIYRSFAGGVITPEMYGRLDLVKYQTGVAEADGFIVLPHGPLANRTGFEYVLEVKDSTAVTCLIPFVYSSTQSMVLEFGNNYVRFHTLGGNLLEAALNVTAATQANPGVFTIVGHGFTTGQWLFSAGITGMTALNSRFFKVVVINANTFSLTDLAGNAIDTSALPAFGGAGTFARVYEITSPYATADLFALRFTQSADVLTITNTGYQQRELRRLGATNWQFATLSFTPTQSAPASASVVPSPVSGALKYQYQVTAIAQNGLEESYPITVTSGASINITSVSLANPGVFNVVAHGRVVGDPVFVSGALGMTSANGRWRVNSVVDANNITLKDATNTPLDTTALPAYTGSGVLFYAEVVNDLTVAANRNTISWPTVAGALRYQVYKYSNGLWGFIGATTELSFVDNFITADTTKTPPIQDDPFSSANNYPNAVGYFGGRRWFGGTLTKLQNMWATRSGTESNMSYSIPSRDDDRISFKMSAKQSQAVQHIVPLQNLIVLTTSSEWVIDSSTGGVLTPSSISPSPKSAIGASSAIPILTGPTVLFGQNRGGRIREFAFAGDINGGYKSNDISVMAPHYFDQYTITQMAFTRAPYPIAWFVRSDGMLLGLTYLPDQQVLAWHSHSLQNGTVESVCVVPEGNEDVLYIIAKRTINGRTVRYIERMHTRIFATLADTFFVDAGVSYSGAAANVISGGWHLEGQNVNVLADGAVIPGITVTGGQITLPAGVTASKVVYGIGIKAKFKTLPVSLEAQGLGQGTEKNISKAYLRVNNSSSISAGPDYTSQRTYPQRTTEPYGSPPNLVSDELPIVLTPKWNTTGQITVEHDDPLPLTVLSMTLDVSLGS